MWWQRAGGEVDEMLYGMREDIYPGCNRWKCEGCKDVYCTHRWNWRWCARCVEDGIKSQKKLERREARREDLEAAIYHAKRELRTIRKAREEEGRMRQQQFQECAIAQHRQQVAELQQQASEAFERLHEAKQDLTQARKVLQRIQRETWQWDFDEAVSEAMEAGNARALDGQQVGLEMDIAIEGVEGMQCKQVAGLTVYNYKDVRTLRVFQLRNAGGDIAEEAEMQAAVRQTALRRECRGLVLDAEGVVARPLHKFFSVGQIADTQMTDRFAELKVVEATMKMDGVMVHGVKVGEDMQLWTRGGPSEHGRNSMRFACGTLLADYLGLLSAVESMGATAIFEWVGRQARIKAKEKDTGLVLLQVRNKVTGDYMIAEQREALAAQYRVECVHRFQDLEHLSIAEARRMVNTMDSHEEGFVLRLENGQLVKLKTQWWQQAAHHQYMRWWDDGQQQAEALRRAKQISVLQTQELRAVLRGWPGDAPPVLVFGTVPEVLKVEAFMSRATGKRGAIVLSFRSPGSKERARASL